MSIKVFNRLALSPVDFDLIEFGRDDSTTFAVTRS